MAKGHDHENLRALESHTKAVAWNNEIVCCVVTGFEVYYKEMWPSSQLNILFTTILFMYGWIRMPKTNFEDKITP